MTSSPSQGDLALSGSIPTSAPAATAGSHGQSGTTSMGTQPTTPPKTSPSSAESAICKKTVASRPPGKIYYADDNAGIYILHGDCREILPTLAPVDLVLTDPPYKVGWAKRATWGSSNAGAVRDYGKQEWDAETPTPETFALILTRGRESILWGGNHFADALPRSSGWFVWDKDNTGDFADCELAWTSLESAVRKFRYRWNGMLQQDMKNKEHRQHPTQKPVPLMQWCLGKVPSARTILDPYMGSGTTLVAAKNMGLSATGIDREERYCEIAAKRLSQEVLDFGVSA